MNIRNFDIIMKNSGFEFKSRNINATEKSLGLTRLIHAVRLGYVELIILMIDQGADIEEIGEGTKTPLMYAIEAKNIRACNILIKNGANIHVKDDEGMSAVKYAKRNNIYLRTIF